MAERRSRLDLAAYGLLVAGLVVALCVLSHDPADAPGATVYPAHAGTKNLLGPAGAWLAATLREALGVAVYMLLASWLVLVVLLLLQQSLIRWSLRLIGWLVLIPCAAVAGDYFNSTFTYGALSGNGGSAGAWLRRWLEMSLQPLGGAAVFGACLFPGLGLAAGFILGRIA